MTACAAEQMGKDAVACAAAAAACPPVCDAPFASAPMLAVQPAAGEADTSVDPGLPLVINVQKFSIHDGPGIRTSIFFKGCHLRCWWCHNPESQSFEPEFMFDAGKCTGCGWCLRACGQGAIRIEDGLAITDPARCTVCGACNDYCPREAREVVGQAYTVEELVKLALQDRHYYEKSGGGVTLSGGECMVQNIDFLEDLCQRLQAEGIGIDVDTCGFAPQKSYERLLRYVDTWLYDIKCIDDETHRRYMGQSNRPILDNLDYLVRAGADINIRIPVAAPVNAADADMQQIIDYLVEHVGRPAVNLLPYHTTGSSKYHKLGRPYLASSFEVPSSDLMQHFKDMFISAGFTSVSIGG